MFHLFHDQCSTYDSSHKSSENSSGALCLIEQPWWLCLKLLSSSTPVDEAASLRLSFSCSSVRTFSSRAVLTTSLSSCCCDSSSFNWLFSSVARASAVFRSSMIAARSSSFALSPPPGESTLSSGSTSRKTPLSSPPPR